jgi:hypothetical protein
MKLYHAMHSTIPFGQACEFRTGSSAYLGIPEELRGQAEVIPNGLPDAQRRRLTAVRLFGFSPEGDTSLPVSVSHRNLAVTDLLAVREHASKVEL